MRRKPTDKDGSTGRTSKWLVWTICITLLFVVIVVYETNRQLKSDAASATATQRTETAETPAALSVRRLNEYYRAHAFPSGWQLASIGTSDAASVEVSIVFSPSPTDPRYGRPAPEEDATSDRFCPTDSRLWQELGGSQVTVLLSDKQGEVATLRCEPRP